MINVFSMFDGVGGFIVGLDNADKKFFNTLYSNQYEPARKSQDAYEVGLYQFPNMEHIPLDVALIPDEKFLEMKDNGVNLIVGGFPCQDYSVARSKKNEMGIEGKKGVLFWEIIRATQIISPKYLILENVDRLLNAPSSQRGRDFAVMLGSFNELGYSVEWRIINAAEYGGAQRRRRVFLFVFKNDSPYGRFLDERYEQAHTANLFNVKDFSTYEDYIFERGLFAKQFPVKNQPVKNRKGFGQLSDDIKEISDQFNQGKFWNSGVMRYGRFYMAQTEAYDDEKPVPLGDILQKEEEIEERFYLTNEQIEKFAYLRGPKKIKRTSAEGHEYNYSEGSMSEYDSVDLPGRTMLTSEGTVNRSTHIVKPAERLRFITPIEAERMQGFPDNWTKFKQDENGNISEVSDRMRLFFMGNALVTDMVKRIGLGIKEIEQTY